MGAIVTGQTMQYLAGFNAPVKIVIGGVVFLVTCLFLAPISRALEMSDIKLLRRVLKRTRLIYPIIAPILVLEEKIIQRVSRSQTS